MKNRLYRGISILMACMMISSSVPMNVYAEEIPLIEEEQEELLDEQEVIDDETNQEDFDDETNTDDQQENEEELEEIDEERTFDDGVDDDLYDETGSEIENSETDIEKLELEIQSFYAEFEVAAAYATTDSGRDAYKNIYGLTYEDLFYQCPQYLSKGYMSDIEGRLASAAIAAEDDISRTDEVMASFFMGFKKGLSYGPDLLFRELNIEDSYIDEYSEDLIQSILFEYGNISSYQSKLDKYFLKDYKLYDKCVGVSEKIIKEEIKAQMLSEGYDSDYADSAIKTAFETYDGLEKKFGYGLDVLDVVLPVIEIAQIDYDTLKELYVIEGQNGETDLQKAILRLMSERSMPDAVIWGNIKDKIVDEMGKDFINGVAKNFKAGGSATALAGLCAYISGTLYESNNPSVSDIIKTSIAHNYWLLANRTCEKSEVNFIKGNCNDVDIEMFETAYNFKLACMKVWLKTAKKCTDDASIKRLLNWSSLIGDDSYITYDNYIKLCMQAASEDIKSGKLVISDSGVVKKTDNGTVIDESYDSTESIQKRFAEIQRKYVPNVGQTWTESWGGTIQCFGFARMVFSKLFGYELSSAYTGSARYKLHNESNVTVIGQLIGSDVTEDNIKRIFQQGKLGDVIQGCGAPYGQHTMILVDVSDDGITVYDCNKNGECGIYQSTLSWSYLANRYGKPISESNNGMSLYRAYNYAEIYGDGDGFFYDDSVNFVIEDGVLVKYNGWQRDVIIPDTVKCIGNGAFKGNTTMYSVFIPDSVVSIETSAFESCTSLYYMDIPDTVTSIGQYAFRGCSALSEAHLPQNNQYTLLANGLFAKCTRLKRINIPKSCGVSSTISFYGTGNAPFYNCSSLNNIVFENGITEIPNCLFQDCTGLKNITIPDSVIRINGGAFRGALNLRSVNLPSKLTTLGTAYGSGATGGTIGGVFNGCKSLEKIVIPDTVVEMYGSCFIDCTSLKEVHLSQRLNRLNPSVFENCVALSEIYIPKSVCKNLNSYLGNGPFKGCSALKNVEFEEGITDIPNMLFSGCTGIEEVNVPSTVKYVRMDAFKNALNLKKVSLPTGLKIIENYAFYGCKELSSIEIPNTVITIGSSVFYDCSNLLEVVFPEGCGSIGTSICEGCTNLTKVVIPNSIVKIPEKAFSGCIILENLDLPNNVSSLGNYAFANCKQLKSVLLNQIESMGDYCFNQCSSLENIEMDGVIQKIPQYAFANCNKLVSVTIPKDVTTIGNNAFANCPSLEEVYIPRRTMSISVNSFTYPITIYGVTGTYAETYANQNNHTFISNDVHASDFVVANSNLKVCPYGNMNIVLNVEPANFTDEITMKSTDTSVLTVTNDGVVTGKQLGTAKVKITVGNVSKTIEIAVVQNVTTLQLSKTNLTLEAGESYTLSASAYPANADNKEYYWESQNDDVATVSIDGVINAISEGTVKIYAKAADGFGASTYCTVTVKPGPIIATSVSELQSPHPYSDGCSDKWIYRIDDAENISIKFSEDTEVEEGFDYIYIYNCNDELIGKYTGSELAGKSVLVDGNTVKIKLVSDANGNAYGFRVISATSKGREIALNKIILEPNNVSLETGDSCELFVMYEPENTTEDKSVVWTSSDEGVATVNEGTVTAVSQGTATITATVGNKTATCDITVDSKITEIIVDSDEFSLLVGQEENVFVTTDTGKIPTAKMKIVNSDNDVVEVNGDIQNGKINIVAKKPGSSEIEISINDVSTIVTIIVTQAMLKFEKQGGVESDIEPVPITVGEYYPALPVLSRIGYTFVGWYTDSATGTLINSGTLVSLEHAPFVAYPRWKADEYTLFFDSNGGNSVEPTKITYKEKYGDLPIPTKLGGRFVGWFTDAEGGTEVTEESLVNTVGDQTLYAHWNLKYTVTTPVFVDEAVEKNDDTYIVIKGSKINLVCNENGSKIYYTIDGTNPLDIENARLYEDSIIISGDVVVKAVAIKEGYISSEVIERHYEIKNEAAEWGDILLEDRDDFDDAYSVPVSSLWIKGISDENYTGKAIVFPNLRVYKGKELLNLNTDYTVKYANNTKVGTASVIITGKGNYSGTITKTFKINPLSLGVDGVNDANLSIQDITLAPTKNVQKGTTIVTYMINGKAVTLKAGTDFTYSYPPEYDFKTPGEHYVTIIGKGNYTGTAKFKELISSEVKLIQKMKFAKVANVPADRECAARTPDVSITDGTYKLQNGIDYELSYQNNCQPGTANIIVTGKGNYSGSKVVTFKITSIAMSKAVLTTTLATVPYTGEATSQSGYILTYTAKKGETPETLVEGIDYIVSYSNATNAGKNKATIIFTGKNRFAGTLKKTYTITPYTITDTDITPSVIGDVKYQKGKTIPTIIVKFGDRVLVEKTDYTVSVANNAAINDGSNAKKIPTVTITGKGNFAGTIKKTFTISGSSLENASITATDVTYQNKAGICKPTITLKDSNGTKLAAGTDYNKTITYKYAKDVMVTQVLDAKKKTYTEVLRTEGDEVNAKDIIPVGAEIEATVIGIKNYASETSKKSVVFRFISADMSKASVKIATQYYSGQPIELSKDDITVTLNKQPLAKTDYEIIGYTKNTAKGTATVTLRGLGNYGGTKTVNFTIANKSMLFAVKYDANNTYMSTARPNAPVATGTMKNSNTAAGAKLTANSYKRKGYVFAGWNTKPDGSGQAYKNQEAFQVKESEYPVVAYGTAITLYAQWGYEQPQAVLTTDQIKLYASGTNPLRGTSVETPDRPDSRGYSYAKFGTYNDFASNNGLGGTEVYIKGKVDVILPVSKDSTKIGGKTLSMYGVGILITDEDGHQWIVNGAVNTTKFKAMQTDLRGKEVTLYGEYSGYSGALLMPAIDWETFVTDDKEISYMYYYL